MADDNITQQIMQVLTDPMSLPSEFWNYMIQKWLADAPVLPISQVFGFTQFTAQNVVSDGVDYSTTSATYADLSDVGPTLSKLPDGQYIFWFGFRSRAVSTPHYASLSLNGSTPTDVNAALVNIGGATATEVSTSRAVTASLSNNGSNTVKVQYRTTSPNTATFTTRWLIALKYGNL